jgi:hypothetical protein
MGSGGGVFRSTNNGTSWSEQNDGITNLEINSLAINSLNNVFAGTNNGVFRSTNNGTNWTGVNNNLTVPDVRALVINPSGFLFAGSVGGGVFRSLNSTITSINYINISPGKYSLQQNYPNPFNPSTVISFQLAVSNFVSLKVYDVLGNVVATLVNEKQNEGTYSVDWNASSFPSGIYFYTLNAGEFAETKRMMLLK